MVGLSEGSVASKQDSSWRKPGENWAGKGEVTPKNNSLLKKDDINERAPRIIFIIRAGRVGASKALLQAHSS